MPNPRYPEPSPDGRLPPKRFAFRRDVTPGPRPLREFLRELARATDLRPSLKNTPASRRFHSPHCGDRLPEPRQSQEDTSRPQQHPRGLQPESTAVE